MFLSIPMHAEEPEFDDDLDFLETIFVTSRDAGVESAKSLIESYSPELQYLNIIDKTQMETCLPDRNGQAPDCSCDADSLEVAGDDWLNIIEDIRDLSETPELCGRVSPSDPEDPCRGSESLLYHRVTKRRDVLTKRVRIAKNASLKESFTEKNGKLNYMVVAERDGWVTLRVHAYNKRMGFDKRFDDTESFHQGRNVRKKSVTLPSHDVNVEIEILNRSDHDITCVLVSK